MIEVAVVSIIIIIIMIYALYDISKIQNKIKNIEYDHNETMNRIKDEYISTLRRQKEYNEHKNQNKH